MKQTLVSFLILWALIISGCATTSSRDKILMGRYERPGIDAGITLTLLGHGIFYAEWWGQEMRHGRLIGGWTTGEWHANKRMLVLHYVTKGIRSEAVFLIGDEKETTSLKLVGAGEFPFVAFFGGDYRRERHHNETFEEAYSDRGPS